MNLTIAHSLQGDYVQDPHRRALSNAIQWHDTLQIQVQKRVDAAIAASAEAVKASKAEVDGEDSPDTSGRRTEASQLLQNRCPACFARRRWGTTFKE